MLAAVKAGEVDAVEQILRTDVRDVISREDASLPAWIKERGECRRLGGSHLLQVDEVLNASANARARYETHKAGFGRCLKIALTDGVNSCTGFELRPVPDLSVDLAAGTKILVVDCEVRRGMLCLTPDDTVVLGGRVESLEEARKKLVERWNAPARGGRRNRVNLVDAARSAVLGAADGGAGGAGGDDYGRRGVAAGGHRIAAESREMPTSGAHLDAAHFPRASEVASVAITENSRSPTPTRRHGEGGSARASQSVGGLCERPADVATRNGAHPVIVDDANEENDVGDDGDAVTRDASRRRMSACAPASREPQSSPRPACRLVFLSEAPSLRPGVYAVKASTFNVSFSYKDRVTGSILDEYMATVSLEDGTAALCAHMSQRLIRSFVGEDISPRRFGSILEGREGSEMQGRLTAHMKGSSGVIRSLQHFDGILKISIISAVAGSDAGGDTNIVAPTLSNGGAKLEIVEMGEVVPRPYAWQLLKRATDAFRMASTSAAAR